MLISAESVSDITNIQQKKKLRWSAWSRRRTKRRSEYDIPRSPLTLTSRVS
ncbi:MAG: hypothetical protein ACXVAU_14195 [Mucilaginibacter sp.]